MPWIASVFIAFLVCGAAFTVGRTISRGVRDGDPAGFRGTLISRAAIGLLVLWVLIHLSLIHI